LAAAADGGGSGDYDLSRRQRPSERVVYSLMMRMTQTTQTTMNRPIWRPPTIRIEILANSAPHLSA